MSSSILAQSCGCNTQAKNKFLVTSMDCNYILVLSFSPRPCRLSMNTVVSSKWSLQLLVQFLLCAGMAVNAAENL